MAAGITQPGAAGTTIFLEDDTNADANLDADNGTYSPADIVAKGLASGDEIDMGSFQKSFRSKASIQNGDGTGTATTTFKAQNLSLEFDNAKSYSVSSVGQANRWTKWGVKVQGAAGKPSGKNGVNINFNASTIIRGNQQIYASKLKQWGSGLFQFLPNATGLTAEMINTLLESVTASITVGTPGGPYQYIYNVDITLGGSSVVSNLVGDFTERVTIAVTGSNPHHINTNSAFAVRDLVLIGTPTIADIRASGASALINPTFSGNAPQYTLIGQMDEHFSYDPVCQDYLLGSPVSGLPIRILDVDGNIIFDLTSDSLGGFSYNAGTVYENALKARTIVGTGLVVTDRGPFRTRVNLDGATIATKAGYEYFWTWPYFNLPSTFGKQLLPITNEIIPIYPAGYFNQGGEPPVIPIEASGVERIFAQVPEAA